MKHWRARFGLVGFVLLGLGAGCAGGRVGDAGNAVVQSVAGQAGALVSGTSSGVAAGAGGGGVTVASAGGSSSGGAPASAGATGLGSTAAGAGGGAASGSGTGGTGASAGGAGGRTSRGGAGQAGTAGQTGGVARTVTFERIELTTEFLAEGANAGDFDRDGTLDVVAGPYWYAGPDFTTRHTLYLPEGQAAPVPFDPEDYSDNFFSFTHDFNADDWDDVLVIGFPGQDARWYENPQATDALWPSHHVFDAVGNESPAFTDLTGDGRPELVLSSAGALGYAEPPVDATALWSFQPVSPDVGAGLYAHGLGVTDVDGDGDQDVIEATGWWEHPGEDLAPPWTRHEQAFGSGGAQIFAYDVDGDGDQDVVTTLEAHEYGVGWFERTGEASAPSYELHLISPMEAGPDALFQPHALDLVDMNGDGLLDLVTGERFWAHVPEGNPSFDDPAKILWYELRRDDGGVQFVPHLIDDASGVGTQVVATDLNADDRPDVVVASKKGAFVFLQSGD